MTGRQNAEPFGPALTSVFRVFGVLLLLCLLTPWIRHPGGSVYVWDLWGAPRVPWAFNAFIVLTALTAVATLTLSYLGGVPHRVKAVVGVAAGAVPTLFIFTKVMGRSGGFTGIAQMTGLFVLAAGMLLRGRYPDNRAGKLLCAIGGAALIVATFAPGKHGASMFGHNWDLLTGDVPRFLQGGWWKLAGALMLGPLVLGVLAFGAFVRARLARTCVVLAWLTIVAMPLALITQTVAIRSGMPAGSAGPPLFMMAQAPLILAAWLALSSYGVAALIGAQLEPLSPTEAASVF